MRVIAKIGLGVTMWASVGASSMASEPTPFAWQLVETVRISSTEWAEEAKRIVVENPELGWLRERAEALGVRVALRGLSVGEVVDFARHRLANQKLGLKGFEVPLANRFANIFTPIGEKPFVLELFAEGAPERIAQLNHEANARFNFGRVEITHRGSEEHPDTVSRSSIDLENGSVDLALVKGFEERRLTIAATAAPANLKGALRVLTLASRFGLNLDPGLEAYVDQAITQFDPRGWKPSQSERDELYHQVLNVFLASTDLEHSQSLVRRFDPGRKLMIAHVPNPLTRDYYLELRTFYDKVPLPDRPLGTGPRLKRGSGNTAKEIDGRDGLSLDHVNHQTRNFSALLSITRSPFGKPNVYISSDAPGETTRQGHGFYLQSGDGLFEGNGAPGLFVTFARIHPKSVEGRDFIVHNWEVVTQNRRALALDPVTKWMLPLEFFSILAGKIPGPAYTAYRHYWMVKVEIAMDPEQRSAVDLLALDIFSQADVLAIRPHFVREYLRLAGRTAAGEQALGAFARRLQTLLSSTPSSRLEELLRIWLLSPEAARFPEVVRAHFSHLWMNGAILMLTNILPYRHSPLLKQGWFWDIVRESGYEERFRQEFIERGEEAWMLPPAPVDCENHLKAGGAAGRGPD